MVIVPSTTQFNRDSKPKILHELIGGGGEGEGGREGGELAVGRL